MKSEFRCCLRAGRLLFWLCRLCCRQAFSRALELAPEYARTKIDFAVMLGGENKLENRIAEIKEWLGRSGSTKPEFLLGCVYYRMGRLGPAKQAIDAAYEKMPQSSAVVAVKRAIDDAIAER